MRAHLAVYLPSETSISVSVDRQGGRQAGWQAGRWGSTDEWRLNRLSISLQLL